MGALDKKQKVYFENPKRFADVIMMRTRNGDMLGLLILENQDSADYSIPVRIFHEEALAYMKQVREERL